MMKWTKCAIRFLRISRPGVRVPSIAPENAVKSKDFMAFLFFWQSLHTFAHLLHTLQKSHELFASLAQRVFCCTKIKLVGARPLHLAYARPFCRLKAPLGLLLLRCAAQTRTTLFLLCTKSCIVWRKIGVWRSFRWKSVKRKSLKLLGTSRSFRLCFA